VTVAVDAEGRAAATWMYLPKLATLAHTRIGAAFAW
jgi:hypothetical protein